MGTKTAPSFANAYFGKFAKDCVYGYPLPPILMFSYIHPPFSPHPLDNSECSTLVATFHP